MEQLNFAHYVMTCYRRSETRYVVKTKKFCLAFIFEIRFLSNKFRENHFVKNLSIFGYLSFTKDSVFLNPNKKFIIICLSITPHVKMFFMFPLKTGQFESVYQSSRLSLLSEGNVISSKSFPSHAQ